MQQLARCFVLIAHHGWGGLKGLQAGQTQSGKHAADGGNTAPYDSGDGAHGHTRAAQLFDALAHAPINGGACPTGARTALKQALLAQQINALSPFARCAHADTAGLGRRCQTHHGNAFNQQLATLKRQSGILMAVHLVVSSVSAEVW